MKTCTSCKLRKKFNDFERDAMKKDGFKPFCKDCHLTLKMEFKKVNKIDEKVKKVIKCR
jgi:hypothetical protein